MAKDVNGVTGITSRVPTDIYEKFTEMTDHLGVGRSTILVNFIKQCVSDGRIPMELLPEKVQARIRKQLAEHDTLKSIVGESK